MSVYSSSLPPPSLSLCEESAKPPLLRFRPRKPASLCLFLGGVVVADASMLGANGTGGTGGVVVVEALLVLPRMRSEMSEVLERRRLGDRPGAMGVYERCGRGCDEVSGDV